MFEKRLLLGVFIASVLSVVVPQMAFSVDSVRTADATTALNNAELQSELQKIENRYESVRNELNEDYNALVKDHDDKCNEIFEQVKTLREDQAAEHQKLVTDYNDFKARMTTANVSNYDEQYKTEAQKFASRKDTNSSVYDASMANLRHTYLLNTQRFEELMKIHNAREALEERKYRQERDFARDNLRLQSRVRNVSADSSQNENVKFAQQAMEERKNMIDQSYQNTLAALDEYKDAVEKRLNDQENYLKQIDGIKQNMARADITPEDMSHYREQLVSIEDQKNIDEAVYNNNVQFIEEKLSLNQMRDREIAALDKAKIEMDRRHAASYDRIASQQAEMNRRLADSSLTITDRSALEKELGNTDALKERQDTLYNQAVAAYNDRRDIIEQAYKERLAYIEDRNDIRVNMAETPVTADNIGDFRTRVASLEERRINEEKAIRDKMMSASNKVPSVYRVSVYSVDMDNDRPSRSSSRVDNMKRSLDSRWNREQQELQNRKTSLQERLNSSDTTDQEKQQLQSLINSLDEQLASKKQRYENAVQKMQERKALDQQMMSGRMAYQQKRQDLMQKLNATNVTYDDIIQYETQLNALDSDWDKQMKDYRSKMRSFSGIMSSDGDNRQWRSQAQSDWQRGVQDAERRADEDYRSGRTRNVNRGSESIGDKIVREYHEVVEYF
ncbi:MAG: hypothetical protein LUD38_15585, partial [Parabacteroides sp.]|nr:hypothetical protein [Parabacteroides sp.]